MHAMRQYVYIKKHVCTSTQNIRIPTHAQPNALTNKHTLTRSCSSGLRGGGGLCSGSPAPPPQAMALSSKIIPPQTPRGWSTRPWLPSHPRSVHLGQKQSTFPCRLHTLLVCACEWVSEWVSGWVSGWARCMRVCGYGRVGWCMQCLILGPSAI